MKADVLRFCRQKNLIAPGDHVVCAVSGGADSMAMLSCLLELREDLQVTVSAAHFNHLLRGEESDGDETFVREYCAEKGIPFVCGSGDAAAYAQRQGVSIEEAARELRYAFLEAQDGLIATAHTADDNAETVLMNLVRGAGLQGLSGIPPRRGNIIRPMLGIGREQILDYLQEHGTLWREDSSNEEDFCRRNRLRHHVLPLLKEENPAFSQTILTESLLLREEHDYLEEQAALAAASAVVDDGYDCRALCGLPAVLLRRVLIQLLRGRQIPWDRHHVQELVQLLLSEESNGQRTLPDGWLARKDYGILRFMQELPPAMGSYELPVPGNLVVQELKLGIRCFMMMPEDPQPENSILLNASAVSKTITVRKRKTGDTIILPGGSRSVKRWLIDKKIPVFERDRLPVLAMEDTILAVYPLGVSRDFLPKPGQRVLAVQFQSYK